MAEFHTKKPRLKLAYETGYIPDIPEELFAEIGCRLVLLQSLEEFLSFAAKVVFAKNAEQAKHQLLKADSKTMGQLLSKMRSIVDIDENFNECLKRTLKARNVFVHEFSTKFHLHTESGIQQAMKFLIETMDDLAEVSKIMRALIVKFGKEQGISDTKLEVHWRQNGDLNEIEKIYVPKASKIFKKSSKR